MIVSVASGKGGTGKTTIAVNLALSLANVQFLDCDVEEPNAYLFLKPEIRVKEDVFIPVPAIDEGRCTWCGRCGEICAYNAIAVIPPGGGKSGSVLLFPNLCHGCGACSLLCPEKAIRETGKKIGSVEIGEKEGMQFLQGRLDVGEAMSPPVIRKVKGYINPTRTVIIDAPPGTSCPVISAVKGCDFCVLVTEPTPFGLNDLVLAVEVMRKLRIPFGVVINRSDLGNGGVENYCAEEGIPVLMRIPFDKKIAEAYSQGVPVVTVFPEYVEKFRNMFEDVKKVIASTREGKR